MATHGKAPAVPVDLLCTGLYVVELDRPWIETPFLFQGFRIACDEELQVLREYCRRVYVDPRRSERQAIETLKVAAAQRKRSRATETADRDDAVIPRFSMPSKRALEKSAGVLFDDTIEPDRKRFSTQVQAAVMSRHQATQAVTEAMGQARLGQSLDLVTTGRAVERLATQVVSDASALLWLNQLQEHSDREARHAVNTCVLALAFGAHLGMSNRELRRLGLGALLHDIGKTRIPPRLLDKTDPLTDQEADIMRRHPELGHELLVDAGQLDRQVLEMVRLHHERWQGQGYPFGMQGETIPRHALMVGLVDSYDAMTSGRPYRSAMTPEQALQELYSEAAGSFGVDLVQALIRCLGIFPVGSVVELDNGAHGLVVGSRPGGGLWPTVLLVRNADGEFYRKRLLINLMAEAQRARDSGSRRVRRGVEPSAAGIDVAAIVGSEFGLAAAMQA